MNYSMISLNKEFNQLHTRYHIEQSAYCSVYRNEKIENLHFDMNTNTSVSYIPFLLEF